MMEGSNENYDERSLIKKDCHEHMFDMITDHSEQLYEQA